jgi:hypothetical protein
MKAILFLIQDAIFFYFLNIQNFSTKVKNNHMGRIPLSLQSSELLDSKFSSIGLDFGNSRGLFAKKNIQMIFL